MELTGAEAGLSGEDQMRIALQCIKEQGGIASMEQIYAAIEDHMGENKLSSQGKASLRRTVNSDATSRGFIYPHETGSSGWRITPRGEGFLIALAGEGVDYEADSDSQELNEPLKPYDPKKIKVDLKPFSVFQVMLKIEHGEIFLWPDFQRNIVWNEIKQSRLIESILINLPLPTFYLDATNENKWIIVDGLQRLWTLDRFYNKKNLKLKGLEFLTDIDDLSWDQLPRNYQRRIEDTFLQLYLIQPETQPTAKFTIFSRVNTGGLFLTPQEIRHALYQGNATVLLKELAKSSEFISTTTGSIPSKRMEDQEIILRFLAFCIFNYRSYPKQNFDEFLNKSMERINSLAESEIDGLRESFLLSMNKAKLLFGNFAFRKLYDTEFQVRYPINKSLFEVWSVLLRDYDENQLLKFKTEIVNNFVDIMNDDEDFHRAISQSTGSISSVITRFSTIEKLLKEIITDDHSPSN